MLYQVRANLFFASEDEARDFLHDCEVALPKSTVVNPNSQNLEFGSIELIENNHDQDPNQPCEILEAKDNHPTLPL